jgi:hypothetical protein
VSTDKTTTRYSSMAFLAQTSSLAPSPNWVLGLRPQARGGQLGIRVTMETGHAQACCEADSSWKWNRGRLF